MATKLDTSTIIIKKIIVHSIPRHKKGDLTIEPQYSEQESSLPDGLRVFFKDKIINSLQSNKELRVCYNTDDVSPVSTYINKILNSNGKDFIEQSKLITKYLFEIQDGQNASGILVVIYGKINDKNTCIIIKLERDEGAQLELNPKTKSFNIKDVKDLMLTRRTKIYKVGLFVNKSEFKIKFDGSTADLQIDPKSKKEVTTWFIEKFLGCVPLLDPRTTTKKFYDLTTTFIQTIDEPIKKAKYTQDLNSYLQKNSSRISANEFADDYMETNEKDNYNQYLKEKNFRMSEFPKDNSFIERKIKTITMLLTNDIAVIGKKGTFENNVKLEKQNDGNTKIEIISKVKSIK
ncbi:nucleoid-associated protein [Algoriphagus sp. D3-2-R+10]|uniref:nucleoid-associated protein n=1 Tax=Algoriphagus aurantiacus TaxID=3103948 RepID=UPI002B3D61AB|nr:nucleoid-associated protein [Algoriphagus sp. D3-2-R+10]MEB2776381.1 nucleoid-associated protein [Algoriphagus sp. D3-2-R+10]